MITCKNCNNSFEGNFCNNCGQKADTKKLNIHYLRHKVQYLILHSDKSVLYACRQLFTRPGDTIREYIEGKRVKYFEPFSMLVGLAAFYGLLYFYFNINLFPDVLIRDNPYDKFDFIVNDWLSNHYALATCLLIPLYSLGSFIAFRKQGYNFIEHLALNAFLGSQRLMVRIVTIPILIIYNGTEQMHIIAIAYIFLDIILITWSYCQFFNKLPVVKSILLSVLSYVISFICFLLLIRLGEIIGRIVVS